MDLSIIIPSYNTKDLLDRCLTSVFTSLAKAEISFEVIVVDNASTDGSPELLQKKYKQVIAILNRDNLGYGKANNQAMKKARGTYILLLNSDTVVLENAIGDLYTFATEHPKSFVGGKLLNLDQTPQSSCGPFFSLGVVFLMLFLKGDTLGITRSSPTETKSVDWVSGACLLGSREAFAEVGYFDEGIFMYMEEIDFLYRARKIGYTTYFYQEARFIHAGAASSGNKRSPVINIYKGLLYFYGKHEQRYKLSVLRFLLHLKAWLVIGIARLTGNGSLRTIYETANSVV